MASAVVHSDPQILGGTPVFVGNTGFPSRIYSIIWKQAILWTSSCPAFAGLRLRRYFADSIRAILSVVSKVDSARLRAGDRTVASPVRHRYAVDRHPMRRTVTVDERR
jgi:hypothetical protein